MENWKFSNFRMSQQITSTWEPWWTDEPTLIGNQLDFLACRSHNHLKIFFRWHVYVFACRNLLGTEHVLPGQYLPTGKDLPAMEWDYIRPPHPTQPSFPHGASCSVHPCLWQLFIRTSPICGEIINTWLHACIPCNPSSLSSSPILVSFCAKREMLLPRILSS